MGRVFNRPNWPRRRVLPPQRAQCPQDVPPQQLRPSRRRQGGQCRLHCPTDSPELRPHSFKYQASPILVLGYHNCN